MLHATLDLAREILGDDFISAEEVGTVYPRLASTMPALPNADVLSSLKTDGFALFAQPNDLFMLPGVRSLDPVLFSRPESPGWYDDEGFAMCDGTSPGWLAIKKASLDHSIRQTWTQQQALLSVGERVPNAAEFAWALTIYYKVRGVYLFHNVPCRTSSCLSDGERICVGPFDEKGIRITKAGDPNGKHAISIAVARDVLS
jgi:hypothetical protein